MRTWPLQEARTRFRDLVDSALDEGPQRITRHGKQAVVVVSEEEWDRRLGSRPSFGDLLTACPLGQRIFGRGGQRGSSARTRFADPRVYVLDTNIVSELSPERSAPHANVVAWLRRNGEHCYLSAVTLTEIAYGVARLRQRGAVAKARRLSAWLDDVVNLHGEHIIVVDTEVASRAGVLLAVARATGFEPDIEDAWIAASAELHGMTVITFNDADFKPMGVAVMNPGVALPPEPPPGA